MCEESASENFKEKKNKRVYSALLTAKHLKKIPVLTHSKKVERTVDSLQSKLPSH